MKPKFVLLTMMLIAVCTACDQRDLSKGRNSEKKVSDMTVPADFDWKTTREVKLNIKSPATTKVRIYNEETCKDESLLAVYTATNAENPLRLHLPIHLEKVWVKDCSGIYPMDVNGWGPNFTLPELSGGGCNEPGEDIVYFPCEGDLATMMFEDYFPIEGDFDFNDLVVNYKYTIYLKPYTLVMDSLELYMRVNAMGGTFPYEPCVRLDGVMTDFVRRTKYLGRSEGVALEEPFSDFQGDVCFSIAGLKDKPSGLKYLNTDPAEEMVPESDLKYLHLLIEFKHEGDFVPKLSNLSSLNIFLDRKDREIHERGYEPARTEYPDFEGCGVETYCNDKNLVWAFTIPHEIKHAKEKVNFLDAYPLFDEWAESKGSAAKYWYTDGNDEYLMTIPKK